MNRNSCLTAAVVVQCLFLLVIGCNRKRATEPVMAPTEAAVFGDGFASGVTFQAFLDSKYDALDIDETDAYEGTASLSVIVPGAAETGLFAGGALTSGIGRNLTSYNALTFYAKASQAATLNVAGIGNDNTGTSKYVAEVANLPLTTSWQKYYIPIPLATRLTAEKGLFYFAEGRESDLGYEFWIDEITYENLNTIVDPVPSIPTEELTVEVDDTVFIGNGTVTFSVNDSPLAVSTSSQYFTWTSSNATVVRVESSGLIKAVGTGTATLTAKLGAIDAEGSITVTVQGALPVPTTPAPTPTQDAADVISLFSDAYDNQPVVTWSANWDIAEVADIVIQSDNVKKYDALEYAGIDFSDPTIDVTAMTRFHMDVWTPNSTTAPAVFKVKLVDFGPNGVYDNGGDDSEHELTFDHNTMSSETWVSIDVPMIAFSGLTNSANVAQLIISGDLSTLYLDNIYFYSAGLQTEPRSPAPIPTRPADSVTSLFSDAYTNVSVDTWSALWDNASVADFMIGADAVKKYTNLFYAGIEFFRTSTIDATTMTHLHMDVWTPDPTAAPAVFKIKLIDFGADGSSGGSDNVEHEVVLNHTVMSTGIWVSIDLPLSNFSGLTSKAHVAQILLSGDPKTVFVDNVYFYNSGIATAPAVPAPSPTHAPADVISLFSDVYTDVSIDTWSANWDNADLANYAIGLDSCKMYTNLVFVGIEFKVATIDATTMTHFHMDVWTPDPTAAPAAFKIKLVDFGADGAWLGGDDVEHEIVLDETTMNTGSWVSVDLPLVDFTGLATRAHLAQLIISCDPNTVFIDNVYFHK